LDPSTKQKLFQTSDIPQNIEYAEYEELLEKGLRIKWKNDVPGYNETHESFYDYEFLLPIVRRGPRESDAEPIQRERDTWNKAKISEEIKFLDYSEYISSDDVLFEALKQLHRHGLVFIKNIPPTEKAVEEIGGRIGQLRETFYGRTWDVKSVPQAKNIAYTSQFLGLHMDLLYMTDPPGLQLLHCLKNSCSGGASMFTDSFQAVKELRHAANNDDYHILQEAKTTYHYKNAGKHYQHSHPTIVLESKASQLMSHVNWSPPFQAPFGHEDRPLLHPDGRTSRSATVFRRHVEALKKFQDIIEREDNIFEYKMNEGECVIFNNRRVLHARRAFDESSGERWLKGAYLDTDTFKNQYRLLFEKYKHPVPSTATEFGTAKRAFQERGAQPSSEDILEEELDDLDDWITNSVQR
jgi:gamma-butyrobetaine dioxygenase